MLGSILRCFSQTTCKEYKTTELPQEEAARGRRQVAKAAREGSSSMGNPPATGSKQRRFNLSTYKLHALGDYANTIQEYGTTDNYTTQVVCTFFRNHQQAVPDRDVRANLSTDESSAFMAEPTSSGLLARLQNINAVSGCSRESSNALPIKRLPMQVYQRKDRGDIKIRMSFHTRNRRHTTISPLPRRTS
jgi:hypothetical protein